MDFFSIYLKFNFVLVLFSIFALIISKSKILFNISSRQILKCHYILLFLFFICVPVSQSLPATEYELPIKATISNVIQNLDYNTIISNSINSSQKIIGTKTNSSNDYLNYLFLLIILTLLMIPYQIINTLKSLRNTTLYKKSNNLKILISRTSTSPFCFSIFKKSYIMLPQFLLENQVDFKTSIKHELQHLRSKDTRWVYILELLVSLFPLNPFAYLWKRNILLDQEFACDESLIAQKKVSPKEYALCLYRVSQQTNSHVIPFGATGMAWGKFKPQLLRRIVQMKKFKKENQIFFNLILVFALSLFTASVFALQSNKFNKKISMSELKRIVNPKHFGDFPIDFNHRVLREVNNFLNTDWGKRHTQSALEHYGFYKSLISTNAEKYGLPLEMSAIAFIESGFNNIVDRSTSVSTAGVGMWQFIPGTALRYRLIVNKIKDERNHIPKSTEAAMHYLSDNRTKLRDLRLAMISYYYGENAVENMADQIGSRNPWKIITALNKHKKDTAYLSRAMAAAIIMKYPSLQP